jgi:hypothetical protein
LHASLLRRIKPPGAPPLLDGHQQYHAGRCCLPPFIGLVAPLGRLPARPAGQMLAWGTEESRMSKPSLDGRHRDKNGEISHKHGNTLVGTLRKIYGKGFAAGYPETTQLSEVLLQLNETSLSQLRRDHETGHLDHKIAQASK